MEAFRKLRQLILPFRDVISSHPATSPTVRRGASQLVRQFKSTLTLVSATRVLLQASPRPRAPSKQVASSSPTSTMKTIWIHVIVLSLASSSSASKDICTKDRLDDSWSRQVLFETSARVPYTNEDRKKTSPSFLSFNINYKKKEIFVVRLEERQGIMTSLALEWHDKDGKKEHKMTDPSGKQTVQNKESQNIYISRVDNKWKVRLVTENDNLWEWASPAEADVASDKQKLILHAYATAPFSVLMPCGHQARPRDYYILTVICLTLVALILIASCIHCLLAWRQRKGRNSPRKSYD
ncbi:uncharacterized protein LOC143022193 [Oratosquilla oratoria]|uniref:uncharacterized protein LOC143022193 n=1 Tax=Oratosquilla oratoria TaxID=337810 RepID=UPI003F75C55D